MKNKEMKRRLFFRYVLILKNLKKSITIEKIGKNQFSLQPIFLIHLLS